MNYFIYICKLGDIRVVYSDKGIVSVLLPYDKTELTNSSLYFY